MGLGKLYDRVVTETTTDYINQPNEPCKVIEAYRGLGNRLNCIHGRECIENEPFLPQDPHAGPPASSRANENHAISKLRWIGQVAPVLQQKE